MKIQNLAVLSLGSNIGQKLENITKAIELIHAKAGTVIKVSSLYESPAWGFEGESFYNCALLAHTCNSASEMLENLQTIEKQMGRERSEFQGYQSRIIDIDLISFNEEIINSENLKVPHPQMQDRLFVLLPMRDLKLDWRHPILQKYLPELLRVSEDKSYCKLVQTLKNPLDSMSLQSYNYIVIEGNIGAGKTTLTTRIAEDFNAKTVLERFADNPFLPKFYEDQNRYAFPLEMSFLADRYQQISDDLA
ncbi:MAG TPA: 2-amino-4-hydroxy-6-hydroxymethyldihydropteridine diphosphokinase, partial [Flavobacterium sp.]